MKKIVMLLFSLFLLTGCGEKGYKDITAQQALEEINLQEYFLLDVRSRLEFNQGHIEGAINVDVEDLTEDIVDLIPSKERKIIVYCQSGNRSKIASEKLISYGYTNVYNMVGGMSAYEEVKK